MVSKVIKDRGVVLLALIYLNDFVGVFLSRWQSQAQFTVL